MPKKLKRFDDVIGNNNIITYLRSQLDRNAVPQCIIFEGEEGIGKTSLAKILAMGINCSGDKKPCYACPSCRAIADVVIESGQNTESVLTYNMSVDSGKEAAKLVKSQLSSSLSPTGKRVIICDEAHAMSDAAQDVFLVDLEYLPKNVYLFFCTTDTQNLRKTLKSRAFTITLRRPRQSDLLNLLDALVERNGLKIQGGKATLNLICEWSEYKPRKALNFLEGFAKGEAITVNLIKEFIGYIDIDEVIPLLASLKGSLTSGLTYIQEMRINTTLINLWSDILTLRLGGSIFKFSTDDLRKLREYIDAIPVESLTKFLLTLTNAPVLTRAVLVSALISSHPMSKELEKPQTQLLQEELVQKASNIPEIKGKVRAPNIEDLLKGAKQVES